MVNVRTMTLLACVLTLGLGGCNGPTKVGIEAREKARNRVALMNSQLTFDQAQRAFDVGRFERALREINAAIDAYDELADYHVLRGRIYLETHRLERAIESFLTALELDEEGSDAHYYAGIVYQRWSDDEQAYEMYARAYELEEDNVHYLLAAAEALVAIGELELARELLEPKLDYFEHNSALQHLIGQIALFQGNVNEAAERYGRAHLLRPDDRLLHEELARVLYQAELYQECYESVHELEIQFESPPVELTLLRARSLAMLERLSDARDAYLSLVGQDPSNVDVWIELGTITWEMEDYHRVAQCSVRTISLAPERFEGYMLKGINERHHGNIQAAIDLFRQAAARSAESPMPHILLGLALEDGGAADEALLAYSEAVRIDPDNHEAAALRTRLLERDRRVSAAPIDG